MRKLINMNRILCTHPYLPLTSLPCLPTDLSSQLAHPTSHPGSLPHISPPLLPQLLSLLAHSTSCPCLLTPTLVLAPLFLAGPPHLSSLLIHPTFCPGSPACLSSLLAHLSLLLTCLPTSLPHSPICPARLSLLAHPNSHPCLPTHLSSQLTSPCSFTPTLILAHPHTSLPGSPTPPPIPAHSLHLSS